MTISGMARKRVHRAAEERDQARPAGKAAGGQKRQRHRGQRAEQGGDGGDVQRLDQGGDVVQKIAGQDGALFPGFGQDFGREVEDLVQAVQKAAGVALFGQRPARRP